MILLASIRQIPASPIAEGIIVFHDDLRVYLTAICLFVVYMLLTALYKTHKPYVDKITHAPTLEIIWTVIPAVLLITIAVPSFSLLYSRDETVEPQITVKAVGHQWYWSYEVIGTDSSVSFDSYRKAEEDSEVRLLSVDNYLYLPTEVSTRILVTSSDVIHSWAVPALGIKVDAVPGRINSASLLIKRPGVYYGSCSELCGTSHGFMPIAVVSIDVLGYNRNFDIEPIVAAITSLNS